MTWNLGTTNQEHLDEHNLFDHAGIATPTPGKILGVSGGKYTQVDAGTGNHDALTGVSPDDHHAENHQTRHQSGGADPLSGSVDANARVAIAKNGTLVGTRRRVNLIQGANVTLTVADDAGSEEVDVTIAAAAGGGGGGLAVTRLTANTTLSTSGVYIVDSAAAIRTLTLPLIVNAPIEGWRFQIKRVGANYVDINRAGTNVFEPGGVTSQRLYTNYSAITLIADSAATMWHLLGYYGAIT